MSAAVCSECGRDMRCDSIEGAYRCQREFDHTGPHLADVGSGHALRWGMVGVGCPDPDCVREPNHPPPHRNGHGSSWIPIDAAPTEGDTP